MAIELDEFRRQIETHQRMVFSLSLRITGDYATAEEVAQDVFLELHRSGDRLESDDHTRFWLRRVTVHRATDALRSKALRPEAAAEEWLEERHLDSASGSSIAYKPESRTCCAHYLSLYASPSSSAIRKRCYPMRLLYFSASR
jgi:RNA polymerase sigma-70 factor (ECF subfamily)